MIGRYYCPHCGKIVLLLEHIENIDSTHTEAMCTGCRMKFTYDQYFSYSAKARIALNYPFEIAFNRREWDEK